MEKGLGIIKRFGYHPLNEPDTYGRIFWIINIDGNDERAYYGTEKELKTHLTSYNHYKDIYIKTRMSNPDNMCDCNLVDKYYI